MEEITAEEMLAGTQPTRNDLIATTPVEVVLAKETWDDIDVEILVSNQHLLDEATKEKLGITKIVPLSAEEVAAQTEALGGADIGEQAIAPEVEVETPAEEVATEEVPAENVDNESAN